MDANILKRIRATSRTHWPYAEAESLFLTEQGRVPADLWELTAFLEALQASGEGPSRRVADAVRGLAIKHQPALNPKRMRGRK